jgi:hypothetical protein
VDDVLDRVGVFEIDRPAEDAGGDALADLGRRGRLAPVVRRTGFVPGLGRSSARGELVAGEDRVSDHTRGHSLCDRSKRDLQRACHIGAYPGSGGAETSCAQGSIRRFRGISAAMGIGVSIILIAVGAILRFAVTLSTKHVNWDIVGDVLMVVGVVGLVTSLIWAATVTRRTDRGTTVVER